MAKDRTTIQDIADALGLSRTTVSKALNGAPHMPEKTVNNVLQMAKKLNYKHFAHLGKIEENQNIVSKGGSFAVLCIELFDRKYSKMVCSLGKPVVFFDSYYAPENEPLNANIILMESRYSTFRMINSILSQYSLKSVGFIGDIYHCISFHERYEGFLNALRNNNIAYNPSFCVIADDPCFHETSFLTDAIRNMPELPELFFCANDLLAVKIITILRQMKINISQDLLICGFDDTLCLNPINSTLTTVRTPSCEMGILATKLLINQLTDPNIPPITAYINGHIQMRSSTIYK